MGVMHGYRYIHMDRCVHGGYGPILESMLLKNGFDMSGKNLSFAAVTTKCILILEFPIIFPPTIFAHFKTSAEVCKHAKKKRNLSVGVVFKA